MNLFPKFSKLDISMRNNIKSFTSRYEPYSDFDFTSLFCWNIENSTEVSMLNNNLIIRLPEYLEGDMITSILGTESIDESLDKLLETTKHLTLVPEVVVKNIKDKSKYEITAEKNQFDYIYLLEDHSLFKSKKFKSKRNQVNRFVNYYGDKISTKVIDFSDQKDLKQIMNIFDFWTRDRSESIQAFKAEQKAVSRLIKYGHLLELIGVIISINGKPCGFSITEITNDDYSMYHFQKTLHSHKNIDIYLTNLTSKMLMDKGCRYINWEQDLGIEGLRVAKTNYQPIDFLKKYRINHA